METPVEKQLDALKGSFVASLRRNNKQIRDDRAISISEDAELLYKRKVEDTQTLLKRLRRDRENMLDLAGTDTTKIISPTDFNGEEFVKKDLDLGLKIRETEITLEILQKRYNELFTDGGTV